MKKENFFESDTQKQKTYFRVEVHYKDANRPLVYEDAHMTFVKDTFYCVHSGDNEYKHPIANIWRIKESWFPHIKNDTPQTTTS